MSATTEARLTPRQRLTRGLAYTAAGPVDVTRGVLGLGVDSAQAGARDLRRRYREGRLAAQLAAAQDTVAAELAAAQDTVAKELAAAQEVVAGLPRALQEARRSRRSRRPWVIGAVAVLTIAAGGVAFVLVRRSLRSDERSEPSPRPPSVEVTPPP